MTRPVFGRGSDAAHVPVLVGRPVSKGKILGRSTNHRKIRPHEGDADVAKAVDR